MDADQFAETGNTELVQTGFWGNMKVVVSNRARNSELSLRGNYATKDNILTSNVGRFTH